VNRLPRWVPSFWSFLGSGPTSRRGNYRPSYRFLLFRGSLSFINPTIFFFAALLDDADAFRASFYTSLLSLPRSAHPRLCFFTQWFLSFTLYRERLEVRSDGDLFHTPQVPPVRSFAPAKAIHYMTFSFYYPTLGKMLMFVISVWALTTGHEPNSPSIFFDAFFEADFFSRPYSSSAAVLTLLSFACHPIGGTSIAFPSFPFTDVRHIPTPACNCMPLSMTFFLE